jgi:hypothetical protein
MQDWPPVAVGRLVHFVSAGICRAAIVTDSFPHSTALDLRVFWGPPELDQWVREVPFDDSETRASGTWHWPEPQ